MTLKIGSLIGLGIAVLRIIFLEEKSLLATYDDYAEYSKRTKRIIPFIF